MVAKSPMEVRSGRQGTSCGCFDLMEDFMGMCVVVRPAALVTQLRVGCICYSRHERLSLRYRATCTPP